MDHDNVAFAAGVRMGIFLGGPPVRGPTRVAETQSSLNRLFLERFFQDRKFTGAAAPVPVHRAVPLEVLPWNATSRTSLMEGPLPRFVNVAPVRAIV